MVLINTIFNFMFDFVEYIKLKNILKDKKRINIIDGIYNYGIY